MMSRKFRGILGAPRLSGLGPLVEARSQFPVINQTIRRLEGIEDTRNVQLRPTGEGPVIDFTLEAPPQAATPKPERGPSMLRSVVLFSEEGDYEGITLRFPSVEIGRYRLPADEVPPAEEEVTDTNAISVLFDRVIEQADPSCEYRSYIQPMSTTVVPHFKTDEGPPDAMDLDTTLAFTERAITSYNNIFFDV